MISLDYELEIFDEAFDDAVRVSMRNKFEEVKFSYRGVFFIIKGITCKPTLSRVSRLITNFQGKEIRL